MRTFRLIGIALFAIVMCVNFASCSKDTDILTDNEIIAKSKKLIGMKETEGDNTYIWEFSYDSEGKLSSIIYSFDMYGGSHRDQQVTRFTWNSFTITAESDYQTRTYTLDENNLVKTIRSDKETDWSNAQFSYNSSNQLLVADNGTYSNKYTWENDEISKINSNDSYSNIIYSGKTCKGYFPLYNYYNDIFYAHPELIGLRNLQLPEQIFDKYGDSEYTEEYTYTFDKDGYVKSCTIVETEKNLSSNYTNTDTTIFTFKWE